MASSGAQLCGFLLSLIGMATTLAASLMVEWEELVSLSSTRIHAGLWMKCSTTKDSFCCEYHDSLIGLEGELLLLLSSLSHMSHFLIKCFWKLFFFNFSTVFTTRSWSSEIFFLCLLFLSSLRASTTIQFFIQFRDISATDSSQPVFSVCSSPSGSQIKPDY